jgi:hypothetical protein
VSWEGAERSIQRNGIGIGHAKKFKEFVRTPCGVEDAVFGWQWMNYLLS